MIIDAHCHWLPEDIIKNAHFFHKGWGDIESHVRMMKEQGIDKAVLSYPTSDAHLKLGAKNVARIYNDNIAKIMRRFPDTFIGAAILPAPDEQAMINEFKRAKDELGFSAVSLATSYEGMYLDDKVFLPVYERALKNNIPIFIHPQIVNPIGTERVRDPLLTPVIEYVFDTTMCIGKLLMSGILEEFKGIKFVCGNFGGVIPFLSYRFDATYQMLRGMNFVKDLHADPTEYLKRIYVDTSGDKTRTNLEAALQLVGHAQVLWGSDWPAKKDAAGSMKAINDLDIPAQHKAAVLGKNLEDILKGA